MACLLERHSRNGPVNRWDSSRCFSQEISDNGHHSLNGYPELQVSLYKIVQYSSHPQFLQLSVILNKDLGRSLSPPTTLLFLKPRALLRNLRLAPWHPDILT